MITQVEWTTKFHKIMNKNRPLFVYVNRKAWYSAKFNICNNEFDKSIMDDIEAIKKSLIKFEPLNNSEDAIIKKNALIELESLNLKPHEILIVFNKNSKRKEKNNSQEIEEPQNKQLFNLI